MTVKVTIPNAFANATSAIPLSQLDGNFTAVSSSINNANTYSNYAQDTGTANNYVITLSSITTTYTAGLQFQFLAANTNTANSGLNVNAQGAKAIVLNNGAATPAGTILAGSIVSVVYDGTSFQIMNVFSRSLEVSSITTSTSITPPSDTASQYNITALASSATFQIPSGTPSDGQKLTLRILDNGTAQILTWTTTAGGYRAIGITLPTITISSKVLYIGCTYNSQDSYWDVVAVAQQV
jgi:hypothetical protein